MNKLFLVSYDLRHINKDYSKLYEAIKNEGEWRHALESTWFIKTNPNNCADLIYKNIKPTISEDDTLFIVDITECQNAGWMGKNTWKWLKDNK